MSHRLSVVVLVGLAWPCLPVLVAGCGDDQAEIKTWNCTDSVGAGTSCICAWDTEQLAPTPSERLDSCDATFNGHTLTCCASSNVFQAYEGYFGACVCDSAACRDGEVEVDDCTEEIGETKTSSGNGSGTGGNQCADKGFCSPSDDHCNCGLSCIHAAIGDYLCGDPCSSDSDCKGKTDPQSGDAYTTCAATAEGFCR